MRRFQPGRQDTGLGQNAVITRRFYGNFAPWWKLKTLPGDVGPIWCLAWTPDSKWIACGSGILDPKDDTDFRLQRGQVVLWDTGGHARRVLHKEGKTAVISLAIAPDADLGCRHGGRMLRQAVRSENRQRLGRLLSSYRLDPGTDLRRQFVTGRRRRFEQHRDARRDRKSNDKNDAGYSMRKQLRGHVGEVWGVAVSADGRGLLSYSSDRTVRLWDLATGHERLLLRNVQVRRGRRKGDEPTLAAVLSPDGKSLIAAQQSTIRLWTLPTAPYKTTQQSHNGVLGVATSPDGRTFASASQDGTIKLWNFPEREELATCSGHIDRATSVAFSPDNKTLASAGWDNTVKLWQASTGKLQKTLTSHRAEVVAVAYNAAGQLFSASIDGAVIQWDVNTGAPARNVGSHEGGVSTLALSQDGKVIAVAGNFQAVIGNDEHGKHLTGGKQPTTVTLWDLGDGHKLHTLTGHKQAVVSVAFRGDGLLATASWDGTVKLWNSTTGEELTTLPQQKRMHTVAFSHDGKTLALGGYDCTVQLWDVELAPRRFSQRAVLKGHGRETTCLAFGKDDQYLVSGSGVPIGNWWVKGGEVLVWDARR